MDTQTPRAILVSTFAVLAHSASASLPQSWPIANAIPGTVGGSALAISPAGQPAMTYVDFLTREIKYATFNGFTWSEATLPVDGVDVGGATSLVYPPTGTR